MPLSVHEFIHIIQEHTLSIIYGDLQAFVNRVLRDSNMNEMTVVSQSVPIALSA